MAASSRRATNVSRRALLVPIAGLLILGAAACGDDDSGGSTTVPATDAAVDNGDSEWTQAQIDEARENAQAYLGVYEDDLPADIRVARRGDEMFALTADYVIGRSTVELDDTDGSGYRVVTVILELPDGSESFDLEAG
jgi:hypothetical protein